MSAPVLGFYSISERMMGFSYGKRGHYAVNSAYIQLANTLSCSMKLYMVFGILEVILEIFLISSGGVSDAPEIYL